MEEGLQNRQIFVIKKRKNRQTKTHLVFDEQERKQFLSGFKKRKDARKQKAKEDMERRLKEERKLIKQERLGVIRNVLKTNTSAPDVESIAKSMTYELPSHTVTITSISDIDFQGTNDLRLGQNKEENDNDKSMEDENDNGDQEHEPQSDAPLGAREIRKMLKQHQSSIMMLSKAMKQKQAIKEKKDRQVAKRKKKLYKRQMKSKKRRGR